MTTTLHDSKIKTGQIKTKMSKESDKLILKWISFKNKQSFTTRLSFVFFRVIGKRETNGFPTEYILLKIALAEEEILTWLTFRIYTLQKEQFLIAQSETMLTVPFVFVTAICAPWCHWKWKYSISETFSSIMLHTTV